MSDTPETQEAVERWRQGKINIFDEMARLERERDEARDMVEKFTEQGLDLLDSNRTLKRERDEAREIIRMAKTKFCEEGSDGNIASDMFAILSSGGIAQWLEQSAHNRLVVGSNPSAPTT